MILAAGTAYAGLWARKATRELAQTESARALLVTKRDALDSERAQLQRQLDDARKAEAKLRADLDRSRTEGDKVSALVGKLEKRISMLESELKAARADAAESKKTAERLAADAASAKTAFEQVAKLQKHVATLEAERDAARAESQKGSEALKQVRAEAARAAQDKSVLEREIAGLKDELDKLRAKAVPEMTGSTPTAAP